METRRRDPDERDELQTQRPNATLAAGDEMHSLASESELTDARGSTVRTERLVCDEVGDVNRSARDMRVPSPVFEESLTTQQRVGYLSSLPDRINAAIWAVFAAIDGLIGLRVALLAFGARRTSGFVDFVYDVSWPFVRPFSNAFRNRTWDQGVIEVSSLLAMSIWLLVAGLLSLIVYAALPRIERHERSIYREHELRGPRTH